MWRHGHICPNSVQFSLRMVTPERGCGEMAFDTGKVRLRGDPELLEHLFEIVGAGQGLHAVLGALETIVQVIAVQERHQYKRPARADLCLSLARTLRRAGSKASRLEAGSQPDAVDEQDTKV